ncbi:membrane integrity-associated transporter subunit PqiC [Rhodoferax sp. 4810]|nr:membrane integrity-associated transporter subunit PqiC [Rhodoferax jenense]
MKPSSFLTQSASTLSASAIQRHRYWGWGLAAVALATALGGCASRAPNPTLYVLHSAPPVEAQALLADKSVTSAAPWQLVSPVRLPAYLDRNALLLPEGANGVQPSPTHRWAELLSSSVPRVLAQDLSLLRGEGSIWSTPLPAGLTPKGQLRVEIVAFDVAASGQAVTLSARWSTVAAPAAPRAHSLNLTVPSSGAADADSLVGAHRLALWQLAQAIAKTLD